MLPCAREREFWELRGSFLEILRGGPLRTILGAIWPLLEPSWALLGRSWVILGRSLGALGLLLGASGCLFSLLVALSGFFGLILPIFSLNLSILDGILDLPVRPDLEKPCWRLHGNVILQKSRFPS